jgi:hypothetical protein
MLTKKWLGYILGDFITNLSSHPASEAAKLRFILLSGMIAIKLKEKEKKVKVIQSPGLPDFLCA